MKKVMNESQIKMVVESIVKNLKEAIDVDGDNYFGGGLPDSYFKDDEAPDYIEPNNFERDLQDMLAIANKFSGRTFSNANQLAKYLKWLQNNIIDKVDNKVIRKLVGYVLEKKQKVI